MIECVCSFEEEYGFLKSETMSIISELIRCKDCRWHYGTLCRNNNTTPWKDEAFCSDAEREEE